MKEREWVCVRYYVYRACGRRPHVTISVHTHIATHHTHIHMHIHMHVERADVDHMSRDARLERAVAPCLAAGVHARQSWDQGCASAAASSARRRLQSLQALLLRRWAQMEAPPQSLHLLLWRLCGQMLAPPQTLQLFLSLLCWQMLAPPQSLQKLLWRLCW